MKRLLLIGSKSGEIITGLSVGFDLFIEGLEDRNIDYIVVDKSLQFKDHKAGTLDFKGLFKTIHVYILFLTNLAKVDLVYTTISSSTLGFIRDSFFIWISILFKKKIVLHLYGGGFGLFYNANGVRSKNIIRKTINKAKKIIVEGELLKDQFSFIDDFEKKIKVVPNGLPYDIVISKITKKTLTDGDTLQLLYLSNMIESKGYLDLFDACISLHKQGVNFQCHFAGEFFSTIVDGNTLNKNQEKNDFLNKIDELGLKDKIVYHGVVKGEKKSELLTKSSVFILPTYYPWEGQPFSIIEAMSSGTPVISTNYRGIPEQLINGYNGFFVVPKNSEEIANTILRITSNNLEYERLSANAIIHFKKNFTKDKHLDNLINEVQN